MVIADCVGWLEVLLRLINYHFMLNLLFYRDRDLSGMLSARGTELSTEMESTPG